VKFIELIAAQGDKKMNSKRIKRKEDLNHDIFKNFDDLFGVKPTASVLVSLLDVLFLKKDVIQRSGTTKSFCLGVNSHIFYY
jgi:U3 small nucleolar RNA-associated protein 10